MEAAALGSAQLSRRVGGKQTLRWESAPWPLHQSLLPRPPWRDPGALGWCLNVGIAERGGRVGAASWWSGQRRGVERWRVGKGEGGGKGHSHTGELVFP